MTQTKLHIAFCTDGIFPLEVGGIQRHSRLLIEAIANLNIVNLSVIHPHVEKQVFNHPNIEEYDIDLQFNSRIYALNCARYSTAVYDMLQKLQPDIVYAQGLSVYTGIADIGYKTIINPHGLEPYQGITWRDKITTLPLRIYLNKIFKHAAQIVSLGGQLTDILMHKAHIPPNKIVVLPNAVSYKPAVAKNFRQQKLQFLFVGRFAHNKGIEILLQAISQINTMGHAGECEFNIVGKGPLYSVLTEKYKLPNVTFHGFADDEKLTQMYADNHIFIFPTLFEGMPTVVLEAMINSMPIIVSDVGATCEQVDGTNGYLIQKNSVDACIDAILKMLYADASKLERMSQASYTMVTEKFTWDAVAQQHIDTFKLLALRNGNISTT